MAKIYYDDDTHLNVLVGKKIGILGYGSQGHAHALNLRDSGLEVIIGLHERSRSRSKAEADGFTVLTPSEVAKEADIIMFLVPDTVQPQIYKREVEPYLDETKTLAFAHGFNIHFHQIVPPKYVDVFMVAPKGPGHLVRWMYEEGKGVPALVAVHQDSSGICLEKALAYAKGIGALVKAGYQPEVAYFECLHELKLIVDLIYQYGISGMRYSISDTAKYGDVTRGERIYKKVLPLMEEMLEEIQKGEFAREWVLENQAGRPVFNALLERDRQHPIEEVGRKLREMMPWITSKELK